MKSLIFLLFLLLCVWHSAPVHADDVEVNGTVKATAFIGDGTELTMPSVFTGTRTIQTGAAVSNGLVVQGVTGQSAALQEWQDAYGTAVASVGPTGDMTIAGKLILPPTTATTGIIKSGDNTLIHTYGYENFYAGIDAGNLTSDGGFSTAVGNSSLANNTTGYANTAVGYHALIANTTGWANTAIGVTPLVHNTTGNANTVVGGNTMGANTTGSRNTAIGLAALSNSTGDYNTAVGHAAGQGLASGDNNTYIGANVQTATITESNTIRIGSGSTSAYIAGISGRTSSGGAAVYVNSSNKLGTVTSSRRYKEEIQEMADATDGLMKLRPVTFFYKKEYADGSHLRQFGLIAEEVAEVYPDLVQYDADGKPFTVYYQFVNAMLLNEVQRHHREMKQQSREIADLKERFARLEVLLAGK
jgi:hypothetical protein